MWYVLHPAYHHHESHESSNHIKCFKTKTHIADFTKLKSNLFLSKGKGLGHNGNEESQQIHVKIDALSISKMPALFSAEAFVNHLFRKNILDAICWSCDCFSLRLKVLDKLLSSDARRQV